MTTSARTEGRLFRARHKQVRLPVGFHLRKNNTRRTAFTLIEVVVATVLSTILLAALLAATASISRDRQRLAKLSASPSAADIQAILQLLRHDLANARSFTSSIDGSMLTMVAHSGLSKNDLTTTGRLVEITYRVRSDRSGSSVTPCLVREQRYLDDPARPTPWSELVAVGVMQLEVTSASPDVAAMPSQVRVRVVFPVRGVEETLWLR